MKNTDRSVRTRYSHSVVLSVRQGKVVQKIKTEIDSFWKESDCLSVATVHGGSGCVITWKCVGKSLVNTSPYLGLLMVRMKDGPSGCPWWSGLWFQWHLQHNETDLVFTNASHKPTGPRGVWKPVEWANKTGLNKKWVSAADSDISNMGLFKTDVIICF